MHIQLKLLKACSAKGLQSHTFQRLQAYPDNACVKSHALLCLNRHARLDQTSMKSNASFSAMTGSSLLVCKQHRCVQKQVVQADPIAAGCAMHMQQLCSANCTQAADHQMCSAIITLCVFCQVNICWWQHQRMKDFHSTDPHLQGCLAECSPPKLKT